MKSVNSDGKTGKVKPSTSDEGPSQSSSTSTPTLNNLLRSEPGLSSASQVQVQPSMLFGSNFLNQHYPTSSATSSAQQPNGESSHTADNIKRGFDPRSFSSTTQVPMDQYSYAVTNGQGGPPPQIPMNQCPPYMNALRAHGVQQPITQQLMVVPQHQLHAITTRSQVAQHNPLIAQQSQQQFYPNVQQFPPQHMRYYAPPSGTFPPQNYYHQQMPHPCGTMPFDEYGSNRPTAPPIVQGPINRLPPQTIDQSFQRTNASKLAAQEVPRASSGTPSAMERSPTATNSTIIEDSLEDSKSPLSLPRTPAQQNQGFGGQRTPVNVRARTPATSVGSRNRDAIIEKLVSTTTTPLVESTIQLRQEFFEKVFNVLEAKNESITQVPQVSKQPIDLHRLYLAVSNKGGFEQVTREKLWKKICIDVNPSMPDSSAAGYQLRRQYERLLLDFECAETGKRLEDMKFYAQRMKKKKRNEKEYVQQPFFGSSQQGSAQPGYGHSGDTNAQFYYQHGDVPIQGRPPHIWPSQSSQGYPSNAQGMQPPHPGAPPSYPSIRPMPPMRPPHPQQIGTQIPPVSIEEQQRFEEQQRHFYQQQQHSVQTAATPSTSLQDSSQNRAASAGPPNESATPDSNSRLSAEETVPHRPPSHTRSITTPPSCAPSAPSQAPPMLQTPQMPAQSGTYYGHSPQIAAQMYAPSNLRVQNPVAMQMKPLTNMYPPGFQQASYPGGAHGYSDAGFQSQANLGGPSQPSYQQQVWMQQQMQRYPTPQPSSSNAVVAVPSPAVAGVQPRQPNVDLSAMSVQQGGGYILARRSNAYCVPPMHGMTQVVNPSSSGIHPSLRYNSPVANAVQMQAHQQYSVMHHPAQQRYQGGAPLMRAGTMMHQTSGVSGGANSSVQNSIPGSFPPAYASTSGAPGVQVGHAIPPHQANVPAHMNAHPNSSSVIAQHHQVPFQPSHLPQFPANSVEATVISQRKRKRVAISEIFPKLDVKRILMSLRSEMLTEVTWAFNVLNAYLYDDHVAPLNLNNCPALLSVLIEYFNAYLSLLLPEDFKLKQATSILKIDRLNKIANSQQHVLEKISLSASEKFYSKSNQKNYTRISRTGRVVHVEKNSKPQKPHRRVKESRYTEYNNSLSLKVFRDDHVSGLAKSIVTKTREDIYCKKYFSRFQRFSRFDYQNKVEVDDNFPSSTSLRKLIGCEKKTTADDSKSIIETMVVRPTALSNRDETQLNVTRQCLAISNILRSLSFLPMNEAMMCQNSEFLFILGRLLRIMNVEKALTIGSSVGANSNADGKTAGTSADFLDPDDDNALAIYEMALQLRDDALMIISNLSVQLDLDRFDSDVSWPIFDGLLHWCVSGSADAKDLQSNLYISPRNSCLETICKMSVIQSNVDLLIATGPWRRIEKFIKVLADLISAQEEVQIREFALVILAAVCNASEPACYVLAAETRGVRNVLVFLETMDSAMFQIAQQRGMQALKENPDSIGSSIAMLRRASMLLQTVCNVESCRKYFEKYQMRLVQLTTSQLMDSKVAISFSSILYDICEKVGISFSSEECQRKIKDEVCVKNDVASESDGSSDLGKEGSSASKCKKLKRSRSEDDGSVRAGSEESADAAAQKGCKGTDRTSFEVVAKKRKLENGALSSSAHEKSSNIPLAPLKRPVLNGEIGASHRSKGQHSVSALQSLPGSQRKTGTIENGATAASSAGSVQAVAS